MKFPRPDRFLVSVIKLLWCVVRREPFMVDVDTQSDRIAECEMCDAFDPVVRQCQDCTCFCDIKTWIAFEKCPRKKWGRKIMSCLLARSKTPKTR